MKESVTVASYKIRFNFDIWRNLEKANMLKKKANHFFWLMFLWRRVLVCSGRTTPIMHLTVCVCWSCCGNWPSEAVRYRLDRFPASPPCPGPAVINTACMWTCQWVTAGIKHRNAEIFCLYVPPSFDSFHAFICHRILWWNQLILILFYKSYQTKRSDEMSYCLRCQQRWMK